MKAIKSRRVVRLAPYDELQQEENTMKVDINTKFIKQRKVDEIEKQ